MIGSSPHALDLTFLPAPARPHEGTFFLYAPGAPGHAPQSATIAAIGLGAWLLRLEPKTVPLRLAGGVVAPVHGLAMRIPDGLLALAQHRGTRAQVPGVRINARPTPASIKAWSQAAKLALELAGREQMVPTLKIDERRGTRAVWAMAMVGDSDRERRERLSEAMPASACASLVDPTSRPPRPYAPLALLTVFLDACADALVRTAGAPRSRASAAAAARAGGSWESRLLRSLLEKDNALEPENHAEAGLAASFSAWAAPVLGAAVHALRLALELVPPEDAPAIPGAAVGAVAGGGEWNLRYHLQATADPGLLLDAAQVWGSRGRGISLGTAVYEGAEERLLRSLAEASRLSPPIERSLRSPAPVSSVLTTEEAWAFLSKSAPLLAQSGVGLLMPAGLERAASKRLRARLRIGPPKPQADGESPLAVVPANYAEGDQPPEMMDAVGRAIGSDARADHAPALGLSQIAEYHWEIALGDDRLTEEEFRTIASLQAPLVKWRGQWVAVDRADLERSREILDREGGTLTPGAALAALVTGETELNGERIEVVADGDLEGLAGWLRSDAAGSEVVEPEGFKGLLRPYQRRGLGWLSAMEQLGLGACLADDMGLGKTIQVIALMLKRQRTTLLVCPTSVVGNWERELARFGPSIPVLKHHGMHRARSAQEIRDAIPEGGVMVTTYALVRRDEAMLKEVPWGRIVLDEAQAIKNAASRQSRAVRGLLKGGVSDVSRITLTGTPVENRLSELWSILDFCNPALLGSGDSFRRKYALPIERWQDDAVAAKLKKLVQPFVLRRLKSDPGVASSLPEKNEMTVICTLSREQASLYQAQVDAAMAEIKGTEGVKRRGRILALITALKQICDHPSLFLKEEGSAGLTAIRSGKLQRLVEMIEEVLANGERVLIFSQFRQMGDRLVKALQETTGEEILFLHGGVPQMDRDDMVQRFQSGQPTTDAQAAEDTPERARTRKVEQEGAPKIFVLSLKAGGLGLNLTAATNVFHFDRWWNPAVEDQATNRAHRIGQTRNVQVYKLVTAGTLEERIDAMLASKRGLAERVLGAGESWLTDMSDEDLKTLVTLGPDAEVATEAEEAETAEGVA